MNAQTTESTSSAPPPSSKAVLRYVIVLLAIPVLLWIPPFFLVRLPSYPHWCRDFDFQVIEFGFKAAGQNADVVIYGDSSAEHGIDPRRMEAALNVRVLDIPTDFAFLRVADDLPLRRYMKADKPPRLIVFYFAPWNLDYSHSNINAVPLYTGMEILLRDGTADDILSFTKANPLAFMQFPIMFYRLNADIFSSSKVIRKAAEQVVATNGHTDSPASPNYADTCKIPPDLISSTRSDTVQALSKKYATSETKVLVYLAPIPSCTNAQDVVGLSHPGLAVVPPRVLPASLYLLDANYIHLIPIGVPQSTDQLIEAVRPLLATPHSGKP